MLEKNWTKSKQQEQYLRTAELFLMFSPEKSAYLFKIWNKWNQKDFLQKGFSPHHLETFRYLC